MVGQHPISFLDSGHADFVDELHSSANGGLDGDTFRSLRLITRCSGWRVLSIKGKELLLKALPNVEHSRPHGCQHPLVEAVCIEVTAQVMKVHSQICYRLSSVDGRDDPPFTIQATKLLDRVEESPSGNLAKEQDLGSIIHGLLQWIDCLIFTGEGTRNRDFPQGEAFPRCSQAPGSNSRWMLMSRRQDLISWFQRDALRDQVQPLGRIAHEGDLIGIGADESSQVGQDYLLDSLVKHTFRGRGIRRDLSVVFGEGVQDRLGRNPNARVVEVNGVWTDQELLLDVPPETLFPSSEGCWYVALGGIPLLRRAATPRKTGAGE